MKKRAVLSCLLGCMVSLALAGPIGPTKAIKIAADYLPKEMSASYARPMRRHMTRSESVADTLAPLYIISRGENAGFVIVSGDDCLPGIIGYTDSGNFIESEMPPALLDMLEGYIQLIEEAQAASAPSYTPQKAVEGRHSVEPIIKAHWHQSAPYNNLAPFITNTTNRALTGCTCTAAVMVLHHFRRDLPGELLSGTPTYGYGDAPVTVSYAKGTPILWDLMQYNYNGTFPEEMRHAVAVLNAAFGAGIWQTYGSSTSGQIANIVDGYNQYFDLGSASQYKGGTSQSAWESLVYSNLANGQPMVYAGVHPDNGGHAIILDGYNASNGLFHFNFGWGGQGDGYYTLDDTNGVNGFAGQQGMVYDIAPRRPKLKAEIDIAPIAYRRVESEIKVSVTNMGTLDYTGFNLYWSTSKREPTGSTKVSASNTSLTLSTDESGTFTASFKPMMERTYYVYLTDKYFNILDQKEVEVLPTSSKLELRTFSISASDQSEKHGNTDYQLLFNDKAVIAIGIANAVDATISQASIRLGLMKYNEATGGFELKQTINVSGHTFMPGESQELTCNIKGLETGQRYAVCVYSELGNTSDNGILQAGSVDTLIHFKSCTPTLECIQQSGHTMVLTGDWDPLRFAAIADDSTYTVYDLTQVKGLNGQPKAANPNALFYVKEPQKGYNIIRDNQCEELRLQPGYNFKPKAPFTARNATFTPQWDTDRWYPFSLPFTAIKPEGYICRYTENINTSTVVEYKTVDTLYANTPYMVMTCNNHPITGKNVTVEVCDSMTSALSCFQAVVTGMVADDNTLVYDYNPGSTSQYFLKVDPGTALEPFTAVIKSSSRRIRSHRISSIDKANSEFAQAIQEARDTYDSLHTQIENGWNEAMLDTISSAYELFCNTQLTTPQIEAHTASLRSYTNTYRLQIADVKSPICFSSMIVNPSFETGNKEGWESDANTAIRRANDLYNFGVGMEGNFLLHGTNKGSNSIKQTIRNLHRGYYRLTAIVGTGKENSTQLFAGDSLCHVKPHKWGHYYMSEHIIDSVWVEADSLTIGIRSDSTWYKADDFNLYYLGTGQTVESDIEPVIMEQNEPAPIHWGTYDLFGRAVKRDDMIPGQIYIVDRRKIIFRKQ